MDNAPYIAGKVLVETGVDNIIPIDFFQKAKKNDGGENPLYKSTVTVVEEFRTVAKDGLEAADTVEITGGQLTENSYTNAADQFIRGFAVRSAFYNRKSGAEPANEFVVSGIVINIVEEVENELPTGTLLIDLLVIGWKDRGDILRLAVEDPKAALYVKNSLNQYDEVKLAGQIVVETKTFEKKEEVAFGDPIIEVTTRVERKLLVNSFTPGKTPVISRQDIQTILDVREGRLKAAKEKADRKQAKTAAPEKPGFSL